MHSEHSLGLPATVSLLTVTGLCAAALIYLGIKLVSNKRPEYWSDLVLTFLGTCFIGISSGVTVFISVVPAPNSSIGFGVIQTFSAIIGVVGLALTALSLRRLHRIWSADNELRDMTSPK